MTTMVMMGNSQRRSHVTFAIIFVALFLSAVQPVSAPVTASVSCTPHAKHPQCFSSGNVLRADWISPSHHTCPLWARHLWWEGHFGADEGGEGWPFPPEPGKLSRYSSAHSWADEKILDLATFLVGFVTDFLLPTWTQGIWLVWYLLVGKSLNPASVDALISPPLLYAGSYLGYAATAVFAVLRVYSYLAVLYAIFLPHIHLKTVTVPEGPKDPPPKQEGTSAHSCEENSGDESSASDPSPEDGTSAHSCGENSGDESSTMDPGTSSMRFCKKLIVIFTQIIPPGWWPSVTSLLLYMLGKLFFVARNIMYELITALLLCIGLWIYQEMEEHRC